MRYSIDIRLGELRDLVEVYECVESCATDCGLVRAEDSRKEPRSVLSVWRDERNGGEWEEVHTVEQALPLMQKDILMPTYDEPEIDEDGGDRIYVYLICHAENLVRKIGIQAWADPWTEPGEEDFGIAK